MREAFAKIAAQRFVCEGCERDFYDFERETREGMSLCRLCAIDYDEQKYGEDPLSFTILFPEGEAE